MYEYSVKISLNLNLRCVDAYTCVDYRQETIMLENFTI